MNPIRAHLIAKGLITPLPTPLTADELDAAGYHIAAAEKRKRK